MPHYIDRQDDKFKELLTKLLDKNTKNVVFTGNAGVGNTFIVSHLLKYMAKRKFFCGGMIHLFLEKVNTVDGLLKLIFEKAIKSFDLTLDEQHEIK